MKYTDSDVVKAIIAVGYLPNKDVPWVETAKMVFDQFPGLTQEQYDRCWDIAYAEPGDEEKFAEMSSLAAEALNASGAGDHGTAQSEAICKLGRVLIKPSWRPKR